jgi:hypothetical protein
MKKAEDEKMMAKLEDGREKRNTERKADFEKMMAKKNAEREEWKAGTMACLGKTDTRIETGQEQSNTETETDREEVEATDLETNPEETRP